MTVCTAAPGQQGSGSDPSNELLRGEPATTVSAHSEGAGTGAVFVVSPLLIDPSVFDCLFVSSAGRTRSRCFGSGV